MQMPDNDFKLQTPFGDNIKKSLGKKRGVIIKGLFPLYNQMTKATSCKKYIAAVCNISKYIDTNLTTIKQSLGGKVTPFSNFRGNFLEEITLYLAAFAVKSEGKKLNLVVVKLQTGEGIITGVALAFRVGKLPKTVAMHFHRDREDVIIGFRRTLAIEELDKKSNKLQNEIIPVCISACKVYVDATRLENILAKAKSMYGQYARCCYLTVAEWDALGDNWHDHHGKILDSFYSPVSEIFFTRGFNARRPPNAKLSQASIQNPYLEKELRRINKTIRLAVQSWA